MSRPLRIAFFVGAFPVVSETFILRQITGLLDAGHDVDIYADTRAEATTPVQGEVGRYHLLERTTFMDMPPESAPWEIPVRPLTGRTWLPGSETSIHNAVRLGGAAGKLHKLPVGLDPAEFPFHERTSKPGEAVRVLTVARLTEIKGHEYVIRAVAKLRERNPAVRYDIVGEGPLRMKLGELVGRLGLQDVV